jgi:hypothetical protein
MAGIRKNPLDIIRKWIQQGDTQMAITQLLHLLEQNPQLNRGSGQINNHADLLSSRYHRLLQQDGTGDVDFEDRTTEENAINNSLFQLLNEIEARQKIPEISAEVEQYFSAPEVKALFDRFLAIAQPTTPKFLTTEGASIPEGFQSRPEDLAQIRQRLQQPESTLMLINGEGGIGKTTLAAKYWTDYKDQYQHLAWIFCGEAEDGRKTEETHVAQEVVNRMAQALTSRFPDLIKTLPQQIEAIKQKMATLRRGLPAHSRQCQ